MIAYIQDIEIMIVGEITALLLTGKKNINGC
jgi:hypothetical protein